MVPPLPVAFHAKVFACAACAMNSNANAVTTAIRRQTRPDVWRICHSTVLSLAAPTVGKTLARSSASEFQHLPRIHLVVGIERALDRAHDLERGTVLLLQKLHLPDPDAVLAAAGAAHREGAQHHALVH